MSLDCLGSDAPEREASEHREVGRGKRVGGWWGGGQDTRLPPKESFQLLPVPSGPSTNPSPAVSLLFQPRLLLPKLLPPPPAQPGHLGLTESAALILD